MKRSSQIGLAAAGVLLVATVWSMTGDESEENLVYNNLSDCRASGQLSAQQCETAFAEATATQLKDAPKFRNQNECEAQYGANGCSSASIGGAQYFIPALAGFMLARGLAGAQPLLPPTTAACPPGSPLPECQQARSGSSSSGSSGGSSSSSSSRSRAYSTTSGRGVTAAFATGARSGSAATTSVSSRGGFGSIARSYSSHSSS